MSETQLPLAQLATLMFSMIGPLGVMPIFAAVMQGASRGSTFKTAVIATFVAAAALGMAILAGSTVMASAGTSKPSLITAAGVILLMTALRNIFAVAQPATAPPDHSAFARALRPIAIPGIVTPVGVAVLIIFVSYFPGARDRLAISEVVLTVLLVDFVAMLFAGLFMRTFGSVLLLVLGAIFGVLQAASGIEMILSGLRRASLGG